MEVNNQDLILVGLAILILVGGLVMLFSSISKMND